MAPDPEPEIAPTDIASLVADMERAGQRVIAAQDVEERLGWRACTLPDDNELFCAWAKARLELERVRQEYMDAVECCRRLASGNTNPY